jgi:predicted nucleotidyltransferase component of viral defense system
LTTVIKLKEKIRLMSKEENIPHEILYQNFFFERFLERLSLSGYKDKLIIKGGYLMTSLLGIQNRSTVDIDFTVTSLTMDESIIKYAINKIINIDVDDGCVFEIINITKTRHEDIYEGLGLMILGIFHSLKFYFKIDLTTGDKITPSPVKRKFSLSFSEKDIELLAYNYETLLAEKLQTIISRGIATTRAKDFFDVYSIMNNHRDSVDMTLLSRAFFETMNYRQTTYSNERILKISTSIKDNTFMRDLWNKYKDEYLLEQNLEFDVVYSEVEKVLLELIQ